MPREGEVDPWSGQRAAFPLNDPSDLDSESLRAIEYVQNVRAEAQQLAMGSINSKRAAASLSSAPPLGRPSVPISPGELNYDNPELGLAEVIQTTSKLFGGHYQININDEFGRNNDFRSNGQGRDKVSQLYYKAYAEFSTLESQHPEECTSLATWKSYTAHNWPIPVSHSDTFRLYKYLTKWCSAQPPNLHFVWAWSLLLRTPNVVNGDEISELRDLCRSLSKHKNEPLAKAFVRVIVNVFGQQDLAGILE